MSTPPPGSSASNLFISGPAIPGKKDHWDMVRGAIQHEDELVNHRLTWLFAIHGFLLYGFATAQLAVLNTSATIGSVAFLEILLALVFACAMVLCRVVGFTVA